MQRQTDRPHVANCQVADCLAPYQAISCPSQVLVVDRVQGPANILLDTISLLLDHDLSVTSVTDHVDALRALDFYCFDMVIIGLEEQRPGQLTLLPQIDALKPGVPVMVVGRHLPRYFRQYARHYGASEIIDMPETAAELRALMTRLTDAFLMAA